MVAQELELEGTAKRHVVSRVDCLSKARDFNWHNAIGFWSAVPLFIVVLSAVVISYTWAGNLVYRIVGETPPAPRANQPAPAPANNDKPQVDLANNLNSAWLRAEQQVSDWRSITLQLPASASAPLTFNIDSGTVGSHKNAHNLFWIARRAKSYVGNRFRPTLAAVSFVRSCVSRTRVKSRESSDKRSPVLFPPAARCLFSPDSHSQSDVSLRGSQSVRSSSKPALC